MTESPAEVFRAARDFLVDHGEDYDTAYRDFRWPELRRVQLGAGLVRRGRRRPEPTASRPALWIVEEDGTENRTGPTRSCPSAPGRSRAGCGATASSRGDRLILMLGNQVELWEVILAAIKLGAVIIPASTLLASADLRDRVDRGNAKHVVVRAEDTPKFADVPGDYTRISVGGAPQGWLNYDTESVAGVRRSSTATGTTKADDTLLLYFTSGTTAKPKLVQHTHVSYPVGHLSTMYWIGLRPGDVHLNISSPGWAKHAWSNLFAPWNAEATVFLYNYNRFDATALMAQMDRCGVTSFCAPPTVWRMLIQADLSQLKNPPEKVVGAGEPLNPEVIEQVSKAWGRHDPRRVRPDRDQRAGGEHAGAAREAGLDGPSAARVHDRPGRPGVSGERRRRGRDLHRPRAAPGGPDGRLHRRRRAHRRGDRRTATTTPATSARATRTATSPTSAARTTCSRRRTTASRRSSWRAC